MNDASLATVGQIIWRLIERHDLEPESFFRAAGIDPEVIRNPHARVASQKGEALLRAVAMQIPDPAFGLQAAHCWHPSNLGALAPHATVGHYVLDRHIPMHEMTFGDGTVGENDLPAAPLAQLATSGAATPQEARLWRQRWTQRALQEPVEHEQLPLYNYRHDPRTHR